MHNEYSRLDYLDVWTSYQIIDDKVKTNRTKSVHTQEKKNTWILVIGLWHHDPEQMDSKIPNQRNKQSEQEISAFFLSSSFFIR